VLLCALVLVTGCVVSGAAARTHPSHPLGSHSAAASLESENGCANDDDGVNDSLASDLLPAGAPGVAADGVANVVVATRQSNAVDWRLVIHAPRAPPR
jgi:hypothetical protein